MIYSTNVFYPIKYFGVEAGIKMLMDAGFPALDMSFFDDYSFAFGADGIALAKRLRAGADARGVVFNQAHAPFQGTYEYFMAEQLPRFPEVFEFCSILGVKNIIVHPIKDRIVYGNREYLFEKNIKYYESLAPLARENGLKIAIENMYTHHHITNRAYPGICGDPGEHVRMYDTLNDPEVFTLCLDVGHAALSGFEPEDVVRILGPDRLGALHIQDLDYLDDLHTLPGCSKLHWEEICRSLGEIDYKGEFTLEAGNFLQSYPLEFIPTALKYMNDTAKMYSDKVDSYRR